LHIGRLEEKLKKPRPNISVSFCSAWHRPEQLHLLWYQVWGGGWTKL